MSHSLVIPYIKTSAGADSSSVAFSPDGTLIVTDIEGTIALWDGKTYAPVMHASQNLGFVFSPDSHYLASLAESGVVVWDVRLQSWQSRACGIAHRNLSQTEWEQFAAGEPYPQICPQFPVHPSVVANILSDITQIKDRAAASAAFKQAVHFSLQSDDPFLSDMVCWSGATGGFAQDVLPACERAVQLDPNDGRFHDSRGLARALTGDVGGAIQDFEQFVNWVRDKNSILSTSRAENNDHSGSGKTYTQEREEWIIALKAFKAGDAKRFPFGNAKDLLTDLGREN